MVAVILFNPQLVIGSLGAPVKMDNEAVQDLLRDMAPPSTEEGYGGTDEEQQGEEEAPQADELKPEPEEPAAEEDPAKALQESLQNEKK